MVLEGKEVEGKAGENVSYSVDLTEKGMLEVNLKIDLLMELDKLVQKSNVGFLKNAMSGLKLALRGAQ